MKKVRITIFQLKYYLQAQLENLKITQGQGCKVSLIKKCLDIVVCSLLSSMNSYIEL